MTTTLVELAITTLVWVGVAIVLPLLWLGWQSATPVSIAVGPEYPGQGGRARRSIASPSTLIRVPDPAVTTLYDILTVAATSNWGETRPAFGSRSIKQVVSEETFITKMVAGAPTKIPKTWKFYELSAYDWMTYAEASRLTQTLGAGLIKSGMKAQEKVTLFAATSREWMFMAHGCFAQSIVITTAYDTLGEAGLIFSLNEGAVTTLFTNADLLPTINNVLTQVPTLTRVIYTGEADTNLLTKWSTKLSMLSWKELIELGTAHPRPPTPPAPSDIACIMYTSGSTGNPKGVILTHANIVCAVAAGKAALLPLFRPETDRCLAYLPLAHILEFTFEHVMMHVGVGLGYGSVRTLLDSSVRGCRGDLGELQPTWMGGVPAVWESIRKGVLGKLKSASPMQKRIFDLAYNLKWYLLKAGLPTSLLDALVFKKIKAQTGGKLRVAFCGGAPLPQETQKFLQITLVNVFQGYGMTETCGTICVQNPLESGKLGIAGAPFSNMEVRLVDFSDYCSTNVPYPQGEIWVRGANVMKGYYKQDAMTAEVLTGDGWLQTGDIGEWRADGNLAIIDRKKNLVKLSNGEYIALENLESLYKTSIFVHNICVYADSEKSYPVAIISPIHKELEGLVRSDPSSPPEASGFDPAELCTRSALQAAVLADLQRVGKQFGLKSAEIVQRVLLVPEEWTPLNGMLTAAQKLKRKDICAKYVNEIRAMYKGAE